MHEELRKLLAARTGVLRRADALAVAPRQAVDGALRRGRLLRVAPRTFLAPDLLADEWARFRLAVTYAAEIGALSHVSALRVWDLPVPVQPQVHLTIDSGLHLTGAPGIRVHRRQNFAARPPAVVTRQGLPVTRLDTSIVDSWPRLDGDAKRAPAIEAVARRMTTPERLLTALDDAPRLAGRRLLVRLLTSLAAGCRSALELWGHDHVLRGGRLSQLQWQAQRRIAGHNVYLDAFDERSMLNIELDGATWHSSLPDRERDLRRDAALMTQGVMVVRFTAKRLRQEPHAVREEVLSIIAARTGARRPSMDTG